MTNTQKGKKVPTDEWLTPPHILEALGEFDLDPCSPINRPWPTAKKHYTIKDNGLSHPWKGRVWCNPPYGNATGAWMFRCAHHGNAMGLVSARTDTKWFFEHVWNKATALLFIKGRLYFHYVDGRQAKDNGGAAPVLVAYGSDNAEILRTCGIRGAFIPLTPPTEEPAE